jgi:2-keto-4-pentenoate hydratase/2-oxohepta-3-ene-1,7-dioic acid hydratase in catechol pathway
VKLATFQAADGAPSIGCVDADGQTVLDLQAAHRRLFGAANPLLASMLDVIDGGDAALDLVRRIVDRSGGDGAARRPLGVVRLLAPVPEPRQIRDFSCFERHMRDAPKGMARLKARLAGLPQPDAAQLDRPMAEVYRQQPIYYLSNRFNVIGHDADVHWPSYSNYLDYELEIGIFIGRAGKNIPRERAKAHIFGYAIFNDFSARDRQAREMEGWMGPAKGKSFDTGNAIGPWIVTPDEIPDVQALPVEVKVNGETWGKSTTANMMHDFEAMIAFVSQDETLHPGEFFGSGTVGGCCGLEIDRWLKDRDVVELHVGGLGILRNRVVRG